jgi:protein-S-isoprenylcysteine O-methyltransferase Ste14
MSARRLTLFVKQHKKCQGRSQTLDTTNRNQPQASSTAAGILARLAQIVFVLLLQAAVLFLSAGSIHWMWAWVFLGVSVLSIAANSVFLLRVDPEMVAERGRPKEMRNWDRLVSGFWSLAQYLLLPGVAGLDIRHGWTGEMSAGWHIAGTVMYASGLALFSWAMLANTFFSTAARIQTDRGQTVCRTGPYQCIRHPGYLGAIIQSIGTALLLGSAWALMPGVTAAALITVRTSLEDRMLRTELTGYNEYMEQVRYRLFPRIW